MQKIQAKGNEFPTTETSRLERMGKIFEVPFSSKTNSLILSLVPACSPFPTTISTSSVTVQSHCAIPVRFHSTLVYVGRLYIQFGKLRQVM